jgi:hypothetical protein
MEPDGRPPFYLEDVRNASFSEVRADKPKTGGPFVLRNVQALDLFRVQHVKDGVMNVTGRKTL